MFESVYIRILVFHNYFKSGNIDICVTLYYIIIIHFDCAGLFYFINEYVMNLWNDININIQ